MWLHAEVLDAFDKGTAPGAPHLPPCLVTDAGDYSLAEWPMKRARWVACSGTLHHSECQIKTFNISNLPSKLRCPGHMVQLVQYPGDGDRRLTGHCDQCMLAAKVRGQ